MKGNSLHRKDVYFIFLFYTHFKQLFFVRASSLQEYGLKAP